MAKSVGRELLLRCPFFLVWLVARSGLSCLEGTLEIRPLGPLLKTEREHERDDQRPGSSSIRAAKQQTGSSHGREAIGSGGAQL